MPYDPKLYWSKKWRAFRLDYLERHPICAVPGCGLPATAVDHKLRRSQGGADFPPDSGLDGLCAQHHNRKSRLETAAPYKHTLPGCDADGKPIAKDHPWNK